jgi:phage gpG-like protein
MLKNISNGREFSDEMNENIQKLNIVIAEKLPDHIKDKAQQLVDKSFQQEQFQDGKSSKWAARSNDKEAGKARKNRRALLVDSGALIAATEAEVRGKDTVAIVVNDPVASTYAPVHNEGLQAGKGKGFVMKQRQFMPVPGESFPALENEVEKFLDAEMDKIFK